MWACPKTLLSYWSFYLSLSAYYAKSLKLLALCEPVRRLRKVTKFFYVNLTEDYA